MTLYGIARESEKAYEDEIYKQKGKAGLDERWKQMTDGEKGKEKVLCVVLLSGKRWGQSDSFYGNGKMFYF